MNAVIGLVSLALATLILPGCDRRGGKGAVTAAPTAGAASDPHAGLARREAAVQLTDAVKAKWKVMKIGVLDLATKQETTYVVKAGADFSIPGTDLTIRPVALVPDFTMDGGVITSKSEADTNPAAQVRITEGGKEVFKGWLFARFPETHPFEHPKVGLRLVAFVPA